MATTWKSHYCSQLEKIFLTPKLVCVLIRVSQTVLHMSRYPSNISFRDTYLCRCNNTIVQIRQWLSVFNGQNHFGALTGARTKNFRYLQPEPEPEILVPAPQSCLRLCNLRYKKCIW